MSTLLWDIVLLVRPRISAMVGLATLLGALFASPYGPGQVYVWVVLGAMCLYGGCSGMNQVQEKKQDACMRRTRQRPVAAGRMQSGQALCIAVFLICCGLLLFFRAGGYGLVLTGLFVLVVYNGIYTPLKQKSSLCFLVGAVAGSVPPLAGWLALGGDFPDTRIAILLAALYCWQVPHCWLLGQRYQTDYQRAGIRLPHKTLPAVFSRLLLMNWILAFFMGLSCMVVLIVSDDMSSLAFFAGTVLLIAGVSMVWFFWQGKQHMALRLTNASMAVCMLVLTAALILHRQVS